MISSEEQTLLTAEYKTFLRTPRGLKLLRDAVEMKKQWKLMKQNSDIEVSSNGVNTSYLEGINCIRIDIIPIGLNNMCHINADLFSSTGRFQSVCGFNVTACPCGKLMCFEIHSVNKKEDTYYDFTKDFNEEIYKYFIPLQTSNTDTVMAIRDFIGDGGIFYINQGCRCNVKWNMTSQKYSLKKVKDMIDMYSRMRFW
jgi:hypothetical protein